MMTYSGCCLDRTKDLIIITEQVTNISRRNTIHPISSKQGKGETGEDWGEHTFPSPVINYLVRFWNVVLLKNFNQFLGLLVCR